MGGDAYFFALVALGTLDLAVEPAACKAWDVEAAIPLMQGAGGLMTDWSGKTHRLARRPGAAGGRSGLPRRRGGAARRRRRLGGDVGGERVERLPEHGAARVRLDQDFVEGAGNLRVAAVGQPRRGGLLRRL